MKTTVEIPDNLFRRLKAHAALTGQTLKALFEQALREKLERDRLAGDESGWRGAFGKVPRGSIDRVQQVIDAEYEQVDLETWR